MQESTFVDLVIKSSNYIVRYLELFQPAEIGNKWFDHGKNEFLLVVLRRPTGKLSYKA